MADIGFFEGIARDLTGRGMFGGSFQLRLILQPLLATLLGIRFGIKDAKQGHEPFLKHLITGQGERGKLLKQSLRDAIIPLCIAFVLDSILQRIILGHIRVGAAIVVGALLVWLPFVIVRALTNRAWSHRHHDQTVHQH